MRLESISILFARQPESKFRQRNPLKFTQKFFTLATVVANGMRSALELGHCKATKMTIMISNNIKSILERAGLDEERVKTLTQQIAAETEKQIAKSSTDLPTQVLVRSSGTATIPKEIVAALGASTGDSLVLAVKTPRRSRKNPDAQQNPSLVVHLAASTTRDPEEPDEAEESEEESDGTDSTPESVNQLLNGRQTVSV